MLDVGKLAYPTGFRVFLIVLMMMARVAAIILLIRVSYAMELRRGVLGSADIPEMLRTLISLDGADKQGLGAVADGAVTRGKIVDASLGGANWNKKVLPGALLPAGASAARHAPVVVLTTFA